MVRIRRGMTKAGCLFTLLLLVAVLYFGSKVGSVYWDYYQYEDAMRQNARFAETMTDRQIFDHIVAKADSLGLPDEAKEVTVERKGRHLTVSADYVVMVELPLHVRSFHFSPRYEYDY
jgi:hypothetical protein